MTKPKANDEAEAAEFNDRLHAIVVAAPDAPLPTANEVGMSAYDQLKPIERNFVDQYIVTDDAMGAFIRSGTTLGLDARAVRVRALELVRRPLVQAAIKERQREAQRRSEITADRVVEEIAKVAFGTIGAFLQITPGGDPYFDLSQATPDQIATLSEVTIEDYTDGRGEDARDVKKIKLKMHDKMSGLDKLARRFGIYAAERHELSGPGGRPIQVAQLSIDATVTEAAEYYQTMLAEYE